jgi:hypothetical protein
MNYVAWVAQVLHRDTRFESWMPVVAYLTIPFPIIYKIHGHSSIKFMIALIPPPPPPPPPKSTLSILQTILLVKDRIFDIDGI